MGARWLRTDWPCCAPVSRCNTSLRSLALRGVTAADLPKLADALMAPPRAGAGLQSLTLGGGIELPVGLLRAGGAVASLPGDNCRPLDADLLARLLQGSPSLQELAIGATPLLKACPTPCPSMHALLYPPSFSRTRTSTHNPPTHPHTFSAR